MLWGSTCASGVVEPLCDFAAAAPSSEAAGPSLSLSGDGRLPRRRREHRVDGRDALATADCQS
jgi:hypothetical protein